MDVVDSGEVASRPLLSTKLDPPVPVPGLVVRPALVDRLATAPGPLTLLEAPAGWGKSSLVSAWFEAETESNAGRSFAFLRLAVEDGDPAAFWSYVCGAIGRVAPDWAPEIDETLRAASIDPTRTLVPNIINALHEQNQPLAVILDDYHTITDPEVHRSVAYLIDNAPRCLNLVISTRTDPPLPVARYRAAGSVTEIRVNDLHLSPSETQRLLDQRFSIAISDDDAQVLCDRTEGWPAGIQLAGVSLSAGTTDPTTFIAGFAGDDRSVADYLTTEVLRRQPEKRRQFLLATSLLEEFNAELCDHLLQTTDSEAILSEIEDGNLFLIGLDSRREWYRYHHLLRDWLRHLHRATAEPAATVELQRRAANWLLDHGLTKPAIAQLISAGDHRPAARAMDSIVSTMPMVNFLPIRPWIAGVSEEDVAENPALATARASWELSHGNIAGGVTWLDLAEGELPDLDVDNEGWREAVAASIKVYRGLLLIGDDLAAAADAFREVVEDDNPATRAAGLYATGVLGIALYWTTGPEAALKYLVAGAAARRRLSLPDAGVTAHLAAAYAELGRWGDAETQATDALALARPRGAAFPAEMAAHYALAEVLHHSNETGGAVEHAQQGLEQARTWIEPLFIAWGCLVLSQLIGDQDEADALLGEAAMLAGVRSDQHRLMSRIQAAMHDPTSPGPRTLATGMILDALTPRELDVLRLLRGDLTIREIGNELYISYNTAKGYTKTIYQKLGVNSRGAAIVAASASNLIQGR